VELRIANHPQFLHAHCPNAMLAVRREYGIGALWQLRPQRAVLGPLKQSTAEAAIQSVARK
jgi:hypothetical protein